MPASDEARPLLEAVVREVLELERLVAKFDRGLQAQDWPACRALFSDYRRVTHALRNALQASEAVRDEAFEKQLRERVQRIMSARDGQIARLQEYHHTCGEKLRTLSNWKAYARSVGARELRRPSVGLDSTR